MSIAFGIEFDGKRARVTKAGELVVAPFTYDETEFRELAEDDTAYNFYEPTPELTSM